MNPIQQSGSLKLSCLAISALIVGCASTPQKSTWQYDPLEESLNAPSPVSAYVHVTQQIQDGQLNYVTCNAKLCPIIQRKTAE